MCGVAESSVWTQDKALEFAEIHQRFCAYYGFNFINLQEYFVKHNLIEFGRRSGDGGHLQGRIMQVVGEEIVKFIDEYCAKMDSKKLAQKEAMIKELQQQLKIGAVARVKNHLSYKLGRTMCECYKSSFWILAMPFVLWFIKTLKIWNPKN